MNRSATNADSALTVCGLVPYPLDTTPSQRFRLEQWASHWKEQGITVDLLPFVSNRLMGLLHQPGRLLTKAAALGAALLRRAVQVARTRRYDAVVIHRAACIVGPALLERVLALMGTPVIFDFDDAIYLLHTSAANRYFGWLKFPRKTATLCRLSAQVVVGNSYLAEYASRHNARVTVVPSSVDTAYYRPQEKKEPNSRIVVGWTGSSTSQTYLELFVPVLRDLCMRRDVELRVHSDREPLLPGVPLVWRRWSPDREVAELSAFDIGIMPMPDNLWAKGKCAMKALLYMAMGLPAVCSAVGTNCEVIRHGENGLLAQTPEDWHVHLGALIDNAALRKRLGDAGRRTVEEQFSSEVCAARFADVIRQAVAGHKPRLAEVARD